MEGILLKWCRIIRAGSDRQNESTKIAQNQEHQNINQSPENEFAKLL